MVRIVLASVLGGTVVFLWATISWMILPWHLSSMAVLPDGEETLASLNDIGASSGVYIYPPTPDAGDEEAVKNWIEKYGGGSSISMLVYQQDGYAESMGAMFLGSYMLNVVGAGLVVCLLCFAGLRAQSYLRRVVFVALLGIFASVVGPLTEWHAFGFSASFSMPIVLDGIIAWSLAGLVIAAFIKRSASELSERGMAST